jgi:hypothetical protein
MATSKEHGRTRVTQRTRVTDWMIRSIQNPNMFPVTFDFPTIAKHRRRMASSRGSYVDEDDDDAFIDDSHAEADLPGASKGKGKGTALPSRRVSYLML